MMSLHTPPSPTVRPAKQLQEEHDRLDRAYDTLLKTAERGDWRDCDAIWDGFCRLLEVHMRYEEDALFCAFAATGPMAAEEAAKLQAEHQHIRQQLTQLGVDIQVHAIRASALAALIASLREHALRESLTLYPWLAATATATATERTAANVQSTAEVQTVAPTLS